MIENVPDRKIYNADTYRRGGVTDEKLTGFREKISDYCRMLFSHFCGPALFASVRDRGERNGKRRRNPGGNFILGRNCGWQCQLFPDVPKVQRDSGKALARRQTSLLPENLGESGGYAGRPSFSHRGGRDGILQPDLGS